GADGLARAAGRGCIGRNRAALAAGAGAALVTERAAGIVGHDAGTLERNGCGRARTRLGWVTPTQRAACPAIGLRAVSEYRFQDQVSHGVSCRRRSLVVPLPCPAGRI